MNPSKAINALTKVGYIMIFNSYATKQVETYCPSCNSFYMDFVGNVSFCEIDGNLFCYATCYECLNAKQDYEFYLAWQALVFVSPKLSFNLSPIDKFYN